jgi:phosphomannomutase
MSTGNKLKCFQAYDVRGKLDEELNEEIAYRIGRASAQSLNAKSVALGFDARESSPGLAEAVARGVSDAGANVLKMGLAGTEEIYAAVSAFNVDAGIEVTASHNPIDYNGMKIFKRGSQPLSAQEFENIKCLAEEKQFILPQRAGSTMDIRRDARDAYINKILSFLDLESLKPIKILINSGNGAAGPTIDSLNRKLKEKGVKTNFVYINHEPDSSFPNGIPNPLLEENRSLTTDAVILENADFGVAFDGDFDRCFLFDHLGNFIPGEYVVGLLAEVFLRKETGAIIVHDPRVVWNTMDVVSTCGGHAFTSKTGHAFFKAAMRNTGAIYGGEMSAHHYFREFACCDSGMIPWLIVWELLSKKNLTLTELISSRKNRFTSSGEMNFSVSDATKCIQTIKNKFALEAMSIDELDGLSLTFEHWRLNVRQSNTEPLVRLNIETRGNQLLLKEKIEKVKNLLKDL